jgi:hypothetical protein
MPIVGPNQTYRLVRDDDVEILRGSFGKLMEVIPDSVPRMDAESAIKNWHAAQDREQRLQARSDALEERERELKAREDAAYADGLVKLTRGLSDIARRMDEFERRRDAERLEREIADADEALAALQSDGIPAVAEAPELIHAEETRGRNAEEAIEKDDTDDIDAGVPSLVDPPSSYSAAPSLPLGALNDAADLRDFGRVFLRRKDRRAYMRAMRR